MFHDSFKLSLTGDQFKPLPESVTESVREIFHVPQDNIMLEGEMLDVAVYGHKLALTEARQAYVQDTVLVVRVLHNEEDYEVTILLLEPPG